MKTTNSFPSYTFYTTYFSKNNLSCYQIDFSPSLGEKSVGEDKEKERDK
jgi:hypothetical protein